MFHITMVNSINLYTFSNFCLYSENLAYSFSRVLDLVTYMLQRHYLGVKTAGIY